jgi:DNA polymerase-3 subunit delta'
LENIVGQGRALGVLGAVLRNGRLSNAYLFDGPWGVGKTRTALAFATALLCMAPSDEGRACGGCTGCRKATRLQHPDLRFLFPVSGEESSLDATIGETLEAMREDPLHLFTYEKAASIRISLTRELLRELPFKPYEAERRVVVVRDADRMRGDQYSAMLKSLEEPGQSTVWVLTTSRANRLPATIRSRCLNIRFGPLSEEEIRDFLISEVAVPEERARLLAAVAAGSLGRALLWRDEDIGAARDEALDMLKPALSGNTGAILAEASKIARGLNREKIRRVLEFQILWLRDVLRIRHGVAADKLANRDRLADLEKSAARVGVGEIKRRLTILEEIGRAIEGNVNAEVAFFSGMSRVGGKINEQTDDWPSHRLVSNRTAV